MAGSDKEANLYSQRVLKEIQEEATRQDRSLSWIVQKAWKISRKEIMKYRRSTSSREEDVRAPASDVGPGPVTSYLLVSKVSLLSRHRRASCAMAGPTCGGVAATGTAAPFRAGMSDEI